MNLTQLFISEQSVRACAFTGHRILDENLSKSALLDCILALVKRGVENFYCGMAIGFDLLAAELVLQVKKEYQNVKLIACIPCYGQERYFPEKDKKRYVEILQNADEKITLSDTYTPDCMLKRNRYMCDNADVLVAYLHQNKGGTAYTVKYFSKRYPQKEIIYI